MATLFRLVLAASLWLAIPAATPQDATSYGIFEGSTDIGATHAGSSVFDRASDSYRITGGGADMWGTADAFHFSWVELAGDATLTADVRFADGANIPLEKAVLIFRQNLEPGAAYADVAVHADGHTTLQYRVNSDEKTADVTAPGRGATRLRIERRGDRFTAFASSADEKLNEISSMTIAMRNSVYVGIGVCAHNSEGLATVTFSNVRLEQNGVPIHGRPRKEK